MSGRLVRPALVAFLVGAAASLVVAGMLRPRPSARPTA